MDNKNYYKYPRYFKNFMKFKRKRLCNSVIGKHLKNTRYRQSQLNIEKSFQSRRGVGENLKWNKRLL